MLPEAIFYILSPMNLALSSLTFFVLFGKGQFIDGKIWSFSVFRQSADPFFHKVGEQLKKFKIIILSPQARISLSGLVRAHNPFLLLQSPTFMFPNKCSLTYKWFS